MSAETLGVVLNSQRLNGAEAPSTFTAAGPFTVALENRGKPVHVHLRFRDRLGELTDVSATNHYVDEGETRHVHVDVPALEEPVSGRLDVVTGHGADGVGVDLTLAAREARRGVDVDESLSRPRGHGSEAGSTEGDPTVALAEGVDSPGTDTLTLLVAGFALVALVVAGVAAATLGSLVVTLGFVAVVLSVGGALYVLRG